MKLTAKQIKRYREAFGITQGELAKYLNVSPATLGAIERGERRLSDTVAFNAAAVLLQASREVTAASEEIQSIAAILNK